MEYGMSALVYNNRVDFTGGGAPPFGNAWFIHGFLPPNTIYWVDNPSTSNPRKIQEEHTSQFDILFE